MLGTRSPEDGCYDPARERLRLELTLRVRQRFLHATVFSEVTWLAVLLPRQMPRLAAPGRPPEQFGLFDRTRCQLITPNCTAPPCITSLTREICPIREMVTVIRQTTWCGGGMPLRSPPQG